MFKYILRLFTSNINHDIVPGMRVNLVDHFQPPKTDGVVAGLNGCMAYVEWPRGSSWVETHKLCPISD